jgi:hypothetical protein
MSKGRFAKRNAGTVNRRPEQQQNADAHVTEWLWSEERAYQAGYVAVINGRVVRKSDEGGAA